MLNKLALSDILLIFGSPSWLDFALINHDMCLDTLRGKVSIESVGLTKAESQLSMTVGSAVI